jgi:uncharacterized damage-inducible protein DinB
MAMTPEQAYGIAQFFIPTIETETVTTRKVLAAVPDNSADYKPAEKSMTGRQLAFHITITSIWFLEGILKGEFTGGEDPPEIPKPSESLALYDEKVPGLIAKLKSLSGEQLAKPTNFFTLTHPMVTYFGWYLNHTIHHRGQLSAYLRPMGGKVPSIYGGSADEPFEMPAEKVSA